MRGVQNETISMDSCSPSNTTLFDTCEVIVDINNWISDGPVGANNAWSYPGWNETYHLCGGDMNIDGNPSDNYVAIEMVNMNPWQPYFMMDEVAIVIY